MPETLDAHVVDSFQFAGQDIPWLVSQIRKGWSGLCLAQWETSQGMSWPAN